MSIGGIFLQVKGERELGCCKSIGTGVKFLELGLTIVRLLLKRGLPRAQERAGVGWRGKKRMRRAGMGEYSNFCREASTREKNRDRVGEGIESKQQRELPGKGKEVDFLVQRGGGKTERRFKRRA